MRTAILSLETTRGFHRVQRSTLRAHRARRMPLYINVVLLRPRVRGRRTARLASPSRTNPQQCDRHGRSRPSLRVPAAPAATRRRDGDCAARRGIGSHRAQALDRVVYNCVRSHAGPRHSCRRASSRPRAHGLDSAPRRAFAQSDGTPGRRTGTRSDAYRRMTESGRAQRTPRQPVVRRAGVDTREPTRITPRPPW